MSETIAAIVVTLGLLIAAVLWVPFLHICRRGTRAVWGKKPSGRVTMSAVRLPSSELSAKNGVLGTEL